MKAIALRWVSFVVVLAIAVHTTVTGVESPLWWVWGCVFWALLTHGLFELCERYSKLVESYSGMLDRFKQIVEGKRPR